MTEEQREQLHGALFARVMREVTEGAMKEAQICVELLERVGTGEDTASQILEALLGDNRVPDEA